MKETKEEVLWETPVEGKGGFCRLEIDGETRTVSIRVITYVEEYILFEDKIKCNKIEVYYKSNDLNNYLTSISTHYSIDFLPIHQVVKIVETKTIDEFTILKIYCSDKSLYKEDIKEV
jgi:hypothetical protein